MAHMARGEDVARMRQEYEDLAVVCYVNSTAELKALSDVCVTSANALKIVSRLPQKDIFFIPDQNLAHYIADQLPEKHFVFNDGYCHVHHAMSREVMERAKAAHPNALLCVHPECKPEVTEIADYAGSTSGIIDFAGRSEATEFIIATELGVMHELKKRYPNKQFYPADPGLICTNMKKLTMEKLLATLKEEQPEVILSEELMVNAKAPMLNMLELAK